MSQFFFLPSFVSFSYVLNGGALKSLEKKKDSQNYVFTGRLKSLKITHVLMREEVELTHHSLTACSLSSVYQYVRKMGVWSTTVLILHVLMQHPNTCQVLLAFDMKVKF